MLGIEAAASGLIWTVVCQVPEPGIRRLRKGPGAAAEGVAVLDGLGPTGGGAHAVDEHVSLDSMVQRAALIALLIAELHRPVRRPD